MGKRKMTDEEWTEAHLAECTEFLRRGIVDAIYPHLQMEGRPTFLSLDQVRNEMLTMIAALPMLHEKVNITPPTTEEET